MRPTRPSAESFDDKQKQRQRDTQRQRYQKQKSNQKSRSKSKTKQPQTSPHKEKKFLYTAKTRLDDYIKQQKIKTGQIKKYESSNSKSKSKSKSKGKKINQYESKKILLSPYYSKSIDPLKKYGSKPSASKQGKQAPNKSLAARQQIQQAMKYIQKGKFEDAARILIKILKHNPLNFNAAYYLGEIGEKTNNEEEAKKYYKMCIKMNSSQSNNVKNHRGMNASKKLIGKEMTSQDNVNNIQNDKEKLIKLAKCHFYLNLFQSVIDICNKILQKQKLVDIYIIKGKSQLARKKFGPAIDSFTNALNLVKISPLANQTQNRNNYYQIYQHQGDCYRFIQAYELALNSYSKYSQFCQLESIRILEKKLQCFRALGNKKKQQELLQKIQKVQKYSMNLPIQINIKSPTKNQDSLQSQPAPVVVPNTNSSNVRSTSTTKSNQYPSQIMHDLLPDIESRPHTPTLQQTQLAYQQGNLQMALKMVNTIIQNQGYNLKNLYWNVMLLFKMDNFNQCQKVLNEVLGQMSDAGYLLINSKQNQSSLDHKKQSKVVQNSGRLTDSQQQASLLTALKQISNKLKQLNAFTLTQQQDKKMNLRRKKCFQDALNIFRISESVEMKASGNSQIKGELAVILEENSMIYSNGTNANTDIHDQQQNSIFMLRDMRKVLGNWCKHKFNLQSIQETTELAFNLVKIRYKQFSILPMHIVYYLLRQQKQPQPKSFKQINDQVTKMLTKMTKKYPPSETDITKSKINMFNIKWNNGEKIKVDLFKNVFKAKGLHAEAITFNSYKELVKAIEIVAVKAREEFDSAYQICREVCIEKNGGFGFKMGLKVDNLHKDEIQQRVIYRIIQKILSKQLKQKTQNFLEQISKPSTAPKPRTLTQHTNLIQTQWQQTINQILAQKNSKNEPIECQVYDFIRAKCMFASVLNIRKVVECFVELEGKGHVRLIHVDNRLEFRTKDVVVKFLCDQVVIELQLSLEFQSISNQFNHGLYELVRSPFGAFFAAIMWFSGFALKKNQIFFRQKIKWSLHGLQHLQKFIYQDHLPIQLINQSQSSTSQFILSDFQMTTEQIHTHICTKTHLYYSYDQESNKVTLQIDPPKRKYIIKIAKQNFVIHDPAAYPVVVRFQGSSVFFGMNGQGGLQPVSIDSSLYAEVMIMKVANRAYEDDINQCKLNQKKLVQIINGLNK